MMNDPTDVDPTIGRWEKPRADGKMSEPALPEPFGILSQRRSGVHDFWKPHERPYMDNALSAVAVFTADQLRAALAAQAESHAAEVAKLKTVMIAAAEEIAAHWDAHCDAEGYGPVNLQHRLEKGIASEYGYTAGNWARLTAERDALRADHATIVGAYEKKSDALRAEIDRLKHNITVLTDAVWKACGDDEATVQATIESQGELK